jgi:hypothetical protein
MEIANQNRGNESGNENEGLGFFIKSAALFLNT